MYCSEMQVNTQHLHSGNNRKHYCNWQFLAYLKDKQCHNAVNQIWAYETPRGQTAPWHKLILSQSRDFEQLNDLFVKESMHNIT
jgi:hypothetical protein